MIFGHFIKIGCSVFFAFISERKMHSFQWYLQVNKNSVRLQTRKSMTHKIYWFRNLVALRSRHFWEIPLASLWSKEISLFSLRSGDFEEISLASLRFKDFMEIPLASLRSGDIRKIHLTLLRSWEFEEIPLALLRSEDLGRFLWLHWGPGIWGKFLFKIRRKQNVQIDKLEHLSALLFLFISLYLFYF